MSALRAPAPGFGAALRDLRDLLRPLAAMAPRGAVGDPLRTAEPEAAEGAALGAAQLGAAQLLGEVAARAQERLERDLCPRTAGGHEHLVVGIVGPNNAGKSALFNALLGLGEVSPSRPTGGATRRLVGALHPALRRRLEDEPTLARFPMRGVTPTQAGVLEALNDGPNPAELLLVEVHTLPEGLLLVDTPDFDSVLRTNREVAAALLCVADVAVAVVTRHTYQNRDVVEFLGQWLAHGRPWVLVYNEAFDDTVTARHAEVLTAGVGVAPVAVFAAPHSLAVARGEAPLEPRAVAVPGVATEVAVGTTLAAWLGDQGEARELKRRALAASVAQLEADLVDLVRLLGEVAAGAQRVQAELVLQGDALGRDVARATMPPGVFLDAFRRVLDGRASTPQQSLRDALRWTGRRLESGARWVGRQFGNGAARPQVADAVGAENVALAARWTAFHEAVVRSARPARDAAREGDPELAAALGSDLEAPAGESLARARAHVAASDAELADFAEVCERLIAAELDRGGAEWGLQLGVDVVHLLPLLAAGAAIVYAGGLGTDFAIAGGGALSSVLAERLSRLLGTGVAREARERWANQRGAALATAAVAAALPAAAPVLARRITGRASAAAALDTWLREHGSRATTVTAAPVTNEPAPNEIKEPLR